MSRSADVEVHPACRSGRVGGGRARTAGTAIRPAGEVHAGLICPGTPGTPPRMDRHPRDLALSTFHHVAAKAVAAAVRMAGQRGHDHAVIGPGMTVRTEVLAEPEGERERGVPASAPGLEPRVRADPSGDMRMPQDPRFERERRWLGLVAAARAYGGEASRGDGSPRARVPAVENAHGRSDSQAQDQGRGEQSRDRATAVHRRQG